MVPSFHSSQALKTLGRPVEVGSLGQSCISKQLENQPSSKVPFFLGGDSHLTFDRESLQLWWISNPLLGRWLSPLPEENLAGCDTRSRELPPHSSDAFKSWGVNLWIHCLPHVYSKCFCNVYIINRTYYKWNINIITWYSDTDIYIFLKHRILFSWSLPLH